MEEIHYCVPVWGAAYIAPLLDVSMPSLLAPGNLPALNAKRRVRLRIFTRAADAGLIRSSAIWPAFRRRIETDIVPCDHLDLSSPYVGMSNLLGEAIRQASAAGAMFIPQAADSFWSDGGFATVGRLLDAGKRLILCGGLRVMAESFIPAVRARPALMDGAISISGPELVDLAIHHLHPSMGVYFANGGIKPRAPVQWFHPAGDRSLVQTIIHAVPLLIAGAAHDGRLAATIDRGFIETLNIPETETIMIGSSDDLTLVDIAGTRRLLGDVTTDPVSDPVLTGRWLHDEGETHTVHGGRFLSAPIRFRGTDADRPGGALALALAARRARRDMRAALVIAEALAAAQALRERGWGALAGLVRGWALTGDTRPTVALLRPYTADVPRDPDRLLTALERPSAMIRPGLHDHPASGDRADGPIPTGLGWVHVVD